MLARGSMLPLHGVAVLSLALGLLSACDSDAPKPAPTPQATASRGFDFELLQWRCNHGDIRTATEVVRADGEFCFAALNLENLGETAASLDPSCQFLLDLQGARYTPDPEAMTLDAAAVAAFGDEISAGEQVENSALYFDVPKGTNPDVLELHEICNDPGLRLGLDPALEGAET